MKIKRKVFARKTIHLDAADSSSVAVFKSNNITSNTNNIYYPTEAASLGTLAVDTTNCSSSNNSREDIRSNNNISIISSSNSSNCNS